MPFLFFYFIPIDIRRSNALYTFFLGVFIFAVSNFDAFCGEIPLKTPQRIVSLVPSLTETLFALGLKNRLVGITDFCEHLAGASEIPSVGTCLEPNIEAIVIKAPDLVLCGPDQTAIARRLENLGVPCVSIRQIALEDIPNAVCEIGKICGVDAEAASLSIHFQSRLNAVTAAVQGLEKPKVLLSVGRDISNGRIDQVYVASPGTYHDSLLQIAGGENACQSAFTAYPVVSYEGLIALKADIIVDLIPDPQRQPGGLDGLKTAWCALDALKAVKAGRVFLLTEADLSIPGPESAPAAAQLLARLFHPDAFASLAETGNFK